jgi:hypothetical protein
VFLAIEKKYLNNSHAYIKEENFDKSIRFHFYGDREALIFSSDELCAYASTDLQYQFLQFIKRDNKQGSNFSDGNVHCNIPLNILVLNLALKFAKELANLHNMYMPSKILLKNAHILCGTCPDLHAVFKLIKQLPMPCINKHGIRKIRRNVPNIMSSMPQNLNIKSLIRCYEQCPYCFSARMQPISFKSAPSVLLFEINSINKS